MELSAAPLSRGGRVGATRSPGRRGGRPVPGSFPPPATPTKQQNSDLPAFSLTLDSSGSAPSGRCYGAGSHARPRGRVPWPATHCRCSPTIGQEELRFGNRHPPSALPTPPARRAPARVMAANGAEPAPLAAAGPAIVAGGDDRTCPPPPTAPTDIHIIQRVTAANGWHGTGNALAETAIRRTGQSACATHE